MKAITVLKFKITSSSEDLEPIGELCRKARNVSSMDWLLRQNGMPESESQRTRKIKRKGVADDAPKSESTKLYNVICDEVPELGTFAATMLASAINSHLSAKVDWRRGMTEDGRRAKRKDAILKYEDRPPYFTKLEIPLHNKQCELELCDEVTLRIRRPLRDVQFLKLTLSMRRMPPRFKKILLEITKGERKLSDSKLLEKDGQWYWFLPVSFEQPEANPEMKVTLSPVIPDEHGDPERPFYFERTGRPWFIGDGRYLLRQTQRIESLIKQIGWRYKQRNGAGHGRKKIDSAVSLRRKKLRNIVDEVRRRAIVDIVRFAQRNEAGEVIYREPTGPVKDKCWFKSVGLDWDWTRFLGDLKNALAQKGVKLTVKKLKMKELQDA